jgi:putative two-component system response regulator
MSTLMRAMEEKDRYTAGHSERVTKYALAIAEAMHLPDRQKKVLSRACKIHDIGKLVVDLSSISKEGPLTKDEWLHMSKHPIVGANILSPLKFLEKEIELIKHHHERWDGKGYPDGLTGQQLDILTSIIIVVDSFDAMTSDRSYRNRRNIDWAIEEMIRCKGTHFNPTVVNVFVKLLMSEKIHPDKLIVERGGEMGGE